MSNSVVNQEEILETGSKQIFLISRENVTIGVSYDEVSNTAKGIRLTSDKCSETGRNNYQIQTIDSINKVLNTIKTKELNTVIQVYVNSFIYDAIVNENYKFWLLTGAFSTGEVVDDSLIAVWSEFRKQMKRVGDYVVFRNVKNCYISDKNKANPYYMRKVSRFKLIGDKYARYCVRELDKIIPRTNNNTDMDLPDVAI